MNNKISHHSGLTMEELRNVIAEELRPDRSGLYAYGDESAAALMRKTLTEAIAKAELELAKFERGRAWRLVLERFDWEAHDVSDHVPGGYNQATYVDFVGTREEVSAKYPKRSTR